MSFLRDKSLQVEKYFPRNKAFVEYMARLSILLAKLASIETFLYLRKGSDIVISGVKTILKQYFSKSIVADGKITRSKVESIV